MSFIRCAIIAWWEKERQGEVLMVFFLVKPTGRYYYWLTTEQNEMALKKSELTRQRLIEAAITTTRDHGFGALTLDGVASQAGVSKGAVTYHFSSKEDLLECVLTHLLESFATRVTEIASELDARPGRWLRAYVLASFEDMPHATDIARMMMAALAENPSLLRLANDDALRWEAQIATDGLPTARAQLIQQMAEAASFLRMLKGERLDSDASLVLRDELLNMIDEAA